MINILKLRKMEKEKSEGTKKPVNPDDEVISLDEGKVVEEKNEKKIDSKRAKKETAAEKKKKTEVKVKKVDEKKKKVVDKKKKEEKKKTSDKKKKVAKSKEENIPEVEIPVLNEEIEITQPEIIEESLEKVVEPVEVTEKVAPSKPIEVNEDAEDAFRQKLMEELLADDFSVEPETEEWPKDIFGNNSKPTEDKVEKPDTSSPVEKKVETAEAKVSGEDELPDVSKEEQAEIDRKKAETLAKFMSKTSPKGPDEEEINEVAPESKPEVKDEKPKSQVPEKKIAVKEKREEKRSDSIAAKEASDEKNKKIENTVQVIGFNLGEEVYGIDINCIREINRITGITLVPNVPDYVEGVINLRGNVIPIINLRVKTKMPKRDFNSSTRVIIIENENLVVGFIVDAVKEVLRIPESIITPPPAIAVSEAAEYIKSVARTESGLIILLETSKLIDRKDFL